MNESITMRTRHLRVYLGNYIPGRIDGRARNVNRKPKRTVPMFIRRRNLYQGRIKRQYIAFEQFGYFAQEYRYIIGHAFLYGLPDTC